MLRNIHFYYFIASLLFFANVSEAYVNCRLISSNKKVCSGINDKNYFDDYTLERDRFGRVYLTGKYNDEYYTKREISYSEQDAINSDFSQYDDLTPLIDFIEKDSNKIFHW